MNDSLGRRYLPHRSPTPEPEHYNNLAADWRQNPAEAQCLRLELANALGLAGHPKPPVLPSAESDRLQCYGQAETSARAMLNEATAGSCRSLAEGTTGRTILLQCTVRRPNA